ncbi:MAG: ABC transporter permease [Bryobacteraceae bacterium]
MRKFLLLAFRNVFRNRRRTVMTLLVVSGGMAGLLLVGGFFSFMFWGLRESTIRNGLGHLQIYSADYFRRDETHALDNGLDDYRHVAGLVTQNAHVRGVTARIEFYGMVSNGMKSAVFLGTGVDAAKEKSMGFEPRLTAGHYLDAGGTESNPALLGVGLASSMSAKVGDSLTLLSVTSDGALNGIDIDVAGIVTTGFKEMDDRLLTIPLPAAQRLLQSARVTKLVVGLDRTENTDAVYAAILPKLAGSRQQFAVRKWIDLAGYYKQVRLMMSGIFVFLGVIVFFMVVMSSANTLMMAMFERTREIGTMLAMGTPRAWLVGLFLGEAVFTGILAAAFGVAVGTGLGALLNRSGVELPPPPGSTAGMPLKVIHEPALMAGAAVLVLITLAVASLMPAVRASRLRIVEALSHV